MPYFQRRSYAETVAAARRAVPGGAPPGTASDAGDILDLAAGVLRSERAGPGEGPFRPRGAPIAAGGRGALVLELQADGSPAAIRVEAGALSGPLSAIPASAVSVSPASLRLEPGAPAEIRVELRVPAGAGPGLYAGALSVSGDESFAIPIEVEVR